MNCDKCAVGCGVSVEAGEHTEPALARLAGFLSGAAAVAEMEIRKLRHDPVSLLTRAIQPALWLLVFGQALSSLRAIPTGGVSYMAYITPGILSQSMMYISVFYGLNVIWDRDQGILQRLLAMPVPRGSFVAGRALGAAARALVQALIIIVLAGVIGLELRWSLPGILAAVLTVITGAVFFSSLSMVIASAMKTRERFMGMGQLITLPLFFASNALYPVSIMPGWLKLVAAINPLSCVVDLLRGYLVAGVNPAACQEWLVLLGLTAAAQALAARVYPRVVC